MAHDFKDFNGMAQVYYVLANGAFMNEKYEKANDLFIKALDRLFIRGSLEDDLNVLDIKLRLFKIKDLQKDYE